MDDAADLYHFLCKILWLDYYKFEIYSNSGVFSPVVGMNDDKEHVHPQPVGHSTWFENQDFM